MLHTKLAKLNRSAIRLSPCQSHVNQNTPLMEYHTLDRQVHRRIERSEEHSNGVDDSAFIDPKRGGGISKGMCT